MPLIERWSLSAEDRHNAIYGEERMFRPEALYRLTLDILLSPQELDRFREFINRERYTGRAVAELTSGRLLPSSGPRELEGEFVDD